MAMTEVESLMERVAALDAAGTLLNWLESQGLKLARYHEHERDCSSKAHDKGACAFERSGALVLHRETHRELLVRWEVLLAQQEKNQ